jgi:hypothetical protein
MTTNGARSGPQAESAPGQRTPRHGTEPEIGHEREQVTRLVHHASAGWAQAMVAHRMAPPDLGFAGRLQALSEAAATEQVAWEQADAAGLSWQPIRDTGGAEPPYELRPETGRRGPQELWNEFDTAVAALNRAIGDSREDMDAASVVGAFWLVANGLERDPTIREDIAERSNVRIAEAGYGAGVYEAVITTLAER